MLLTLPLDVVLTVLTLAVAMQTVQLVLVTFEISRMRRDMLVLLRITSSLNHAVNPWADEDEPTEPGYFHPPRLKRRTRHVSQWILQLTQRAKQKRQPPPS